MADGNPKIDVVGTSTTEKICYCRLRYRRMRRTGSRNSLRARGLPVWGDWKRLSRFCWRHPDNLDSRDRVHSTRPLPDLHIKFGATWGGGWNPRCSEWAFWEICYYPRGRLARLGRLPSRTILCLRDVVGWIFHPRGPRIAAWTSLCYSSGCLNGRAMALAALYPASYPWSDCSGRLSAPLAVLSF